MGDYHVIAVLDARTSDGNGKSWVLDLDTLLDFPCEFKEYFRKVFQPDVRLSADSRELDRWFRGVGSQDFLKNLRSDRSHMMDSQGNYESPPPPEAPIGDGGTNLFQDFVSMDEARGYGRVLSERKFF